MRIILVFVGLVLLISASKSFFIVYQMEQAIVLEFGKIKEKTGSTDGALTEPGLYFKIPYVQTVIKYDQRVLDLDAKPTEVIDSDKKPLIIDAFVKYRIKNPLEFYKSVKTERRANERLGTFLESSLRQEMGGNSIDDMLSVKRTIVMQNIEKDVITKAQEIGVQIVDVKIMRADFPEANTEKIYNIMKTEREQEAKMYRAEGAQRAQEIQAIADKERTIIIATAEKQSNILRGEGDAAVTKILGDAYGKDVSFYEFYRSLEAYKKTMTDKNTTMVISPDSEFFKHFNGTKFGK